MHKISIILFQEKRWRMFLEVDWQVSVDNFVNKNIKLRNKFQ